MANEAMEVTVFGMTVPLQPLTNSLVEVLMTALQLSRLSKVLFCSLIVMVIRLTQLPNALEPIELTPLPMETERNCLQPLKAFAPMVVTLSGMVTSVSLEQASKPFSPIVVTVLGRVSEVI